MSLLSSLSASRGRKLALAALSATVIGAAAIPTSANAFPVIPCWKLGTCGGGGYGKGWGYGGAALGGFALGAIAASAASANDGGGCYLTRHVYFRKVRVCD